jgi:hypothetical protein
MPAGNVKTGKRSANFFPPSSLELVLKLTQFALNRQFVRHLLVATITKKRSALGIIHALCYW